MNQMTPIAAGGVVTAQQRTPYFAVSTTKLLVMSVCTFGLYEIYWFYRNWRSIKEHERSDIMPVWRSLFAVFFCYPLFKRIEESTGEPDGLGLPTVVLAAGWIIVTLLIRLPDPYWLVAFFAVIPILPVQSAANRVNAAAAPDHNPNRNFSGWNIVAIVIGGLLLVLGIIAALLPPAGT